MNLERSGSFFFMTMSMDFWLYPHSLRAASWIASLSCNSGDPALEGPQEYGFDLEGPWPSLDILETINVLKGGKKLY